MVATIAVNIVEFANGNVRLEYTKFSHETWEALIRSATKNFRIPQSFLGLQSIKQLLSYEAINCMHVDNIVNSKSIRLADGGIHSSNAKYIELASSGTLLTSLEEAEKAKEEQLEHEQITNHLVLSAASQLFMLQVTWTPQPLWDEDSTICHLKRFSYNAREVVVADTFNLREFLKENGARGVTVLARLRNIARDIVRQQEEAIKKTRKQYDQCEQRLHSLGIALWQR